MIKDTFIKIRVTKVEKDQYTKLAKDRGITLSDIIRDLLVKEILKGEK